MGAPLQSHSVSDFVRIALGLELDKHVVNDPNQITAPAAVDLQTAIDLANTYRALFNTHIQAAPPGASIQLVDP